MTTRSRPVLNIRSARAEEADALTALCVRSKAHWGYDDAFMRASAAALTISPAMIARGRVLVAVDEAGALLGVASAEPLGTAGDFDLAHFFIEPSVLRAGVGRALFAAIVAAVQAEGGTKLAILSDPFAVDFYRKMGATVLGDAPSDTIPGRRLPFLALEILETDQPG